MRNFASSRNASVFVRCVYTSVTRNVKLDDSNDGNEEDENEDEDDEDKNDYDDG